jgi:hypothetical protein
MSKDTVATKEEIEQQVRGMVMQLQATGFAKGYASFAEAMEATDMWTFVYHQAEVLATAYAYTRKLDAMMHRTC